MKAVRWLHLLSLVTVLLSSTVVFTPPTEAQTIRVLLVGNDSNVSHYAKNMEMIVGLLKKVAQKTGSDLDSTRADFAIADLTPVHEQAKEWLENVRPNRNDVVFIYYSRVEGSEAMTEEDAEPDEQADSPTPLDIEEFAEKLSKKSGRLKILITDNNLHHVDNADVTDNTPDVSMSVLNNLFAEHIGFLHLNSKSKDEFAFGDANGGWFTQALISAIHAEVEEDDGFVFWEEVLEKTQVGIKKLYDKNSPNFSDELKDNMREHRIKDSQTPIARGSFPKSVFEVDNLMGGAGSANAYFPTVHALLVIADAADIDEKSVAKMNQTRIRGLLRGAEDLGICNVEIQSLLASDDGLKAAKVQAWAAAVSPRENDTVFIYYSANDGDDVDAQGELLNALKAAITGDNAKKSRLQMLIVDTYRIGPGIITPRFGLPYPQTVFHNLFLEHKGFLHLVSKSKDELSFGDAYDGGWFTRALVESIYEIRDREDFPAQVPDPDRDFLGWKELVEVTKKRTMKLFEDSYPDGFENAENYPAAFSEEDRQKILDALGMEGVKRSQTPKAHELPKKM